MKQGGLYRRATPDAVPELVERTRSVDEQDTPEGRSGTAREAPSTDSGSEGLVQGSEGLHATAPQDDVAGAAGAGAGDVTPQTPAAEPGAAGPSAPAPSRRSPKET